MKFFRHQFSSIEQYLHHRAPYLLVEKIVSCSAKEIVTQKTLSGDEYFLPGHFPGAPILPGAMMQELTTQTAGILIAAEYNPMEEYNTADPTFNEYALGVLVRVEGARYKSFVRPGDEMTVKVTLDEHLNDIFDFHGKITVGEKNIMQNSFRLTNIKSTVLMGQEA